MNSQWPEDKHVPMDEILEAIKRLAYGSVLIKVHQGKVVEYEVTEKKRL